MTMECHVVNFESSRMVWLDALRLVAGVSMLCLHSTADASGQPFAAYPVADRIAPMILRAFIYVARTELFIIIALFLLVLGLERRPRSFGMVISEQARRLLLPFLFWTVFYSGFNLLKATAYGYADSAWAQLLDPVAWAQFLVLGAVKYHMHFLPTLFAIILFYPVFRVAERQPWLACFCLLGLAARHEVDGFLYETLFGSAWLEFAIRATKVFSYVGYGMIAAALAGLWRISKDQDRLSWLLPLLWLGGLLFAVKLIATFQTITTGQWAFSYIPGYWADFLMPCVLFAVCFSQASRRWPAALSTWAPYSFGVYLCHPIFLDLIEILLLDTTLSPIAQVGLKIGGTFFCTTILVLLLARVPFMGWTIGHGQSPSLRSIIFSREKKEPA
jgi:surface polysaccharide O-acyltransferase-like enzyme